MSGFDLGLAPRPGGLTHVIDKGLGPRGWEDVLETSGDYIDIVKLGWGTAYVTPNLRAKLDVLRGKPVVIGGTFFEVVVVQDKVEDYKRWLVELGLTHVEISDGVIDLPRERKLELIEEFARDFTVLSEVGSKDSDVEFTPDEWTTWLREELDAGAWKVITEAREGGTAGIFSESGDMRTELVGEIAKRECRSRTWSSRRRPRPLRPGSSRSTALPSTSGTSLRTTSSRSRRSAAAFAATR